MRVAGNVRAFRLILNLLDVLHCDDFLKQRMPSAIHCVVLQCVPTVALTVDAGADESKQRRRRRPAGRSRQRQRNAKVDSKTNKNDDDDDDDANDETEKRTTGANNDVDEDANDDADNDGALRRRMASVAVELLVERVHVAAEFCQRRAQISAAALPPPPAAAAAAASTSKTNDDVAQRELCGVLAVASIVSSNFQRSIGA